MSGVLCVDIGGTSTKAGVLGAGGEVRSVLSIATKPDAESYLSNLIELIATTRDSGESRPSQLGVAVAGFLDPARTRLVYNTNLAWLEGFPLQERLKERFPELAIELEVDSNAATMAEYQLGSGRGSKRFLCVACGTGVGVGLAVDGVPVRFAYGCLGDVGHLIVQRDGPVCTCGGKGCVEIMVSARVLAAEYQALARRPGEVTLRNVIEDAQAGNAAAVSILERAGEWVGLAVASMANLFFPDHIAIAGGLSAAGDMVLKPAERVFRESAAILARSNTTFQRASLGSMATLIGAAWPFWQKEKT